MKADGRLPDFRRFSWSRVRTSYEIPNTHVAVDRVAEYVIGRGS
jgi:hypothetical protein